jgi:hypothetical protein
VCGAGGSTYEMDNPLSTSGTTYIKHDGTVDAANGITF